MKNLPGRKAQNLKQMFAVGLAAQDRQQLETAARIYREILEIDPNHVEAQYNLAILNHDSGNLEKALQGYRKVTILRPELAEAHKNSGDALFAMEQLELNRTVLKLYTTWVWSKNIARTSTMR